MSRRKVGPKPLLFPLPTVIVGIEIDGRPNYMTVGYCGMVGGPPSTIAVGIGDQSATYHAIANCAGFSVNIPSAAQVVETDYVGIVSARDTDKSNVFTSFYGELPGVPMIAECPVAMECRLTQVHRLGTMLACYGEIVETHVHDSCFEGDVVAIARVDPLVLSPSESTYLRVGEVVARAYQAGKAYDPDRRSS